MEGQRGYNYSSQEPSYQPRREELLRLDFHPSNRWRLAARYMHNQDDREIAYGTPGLFGSTVPTFEGRGGHSLPSAVAAPTTLTFE